MITPLKLAMPTPNGSWPGVAARWGWPNNQRSNVIPGEADQGDWRPA
jgi:hypothetical protein